MKKTKGRNAGKVKGVGDKTVACHAGCKCAVTTCTSAESPMLLKPELDSSHGRFNYAESQIAVGHFMASDAYLYSRNHIFVLDELTAPFYDALVRGGEIPMVVMPRSGEIIKRTRNYYSGGSTLFIVSCLGIGPHGLVVRTENYHKLLQELQDGGHIDKDTKWLAIAADASQPDVPTSCICPFTGGYLLTPAKGIVQWRKAVETTGGRL